MRFSLLRARQDFLSAPVKIFSSRPSRFSLLRARQDGLWGPHSPLLSLLAYVNNMYSPAIPLLLPLCLRGTLRVDLYLRIKQHISICRYVELEVYSLGKSLCLVERDFYTLGA